jgi:ABC-type multidrug transport system fused ATPase/permease subunit
MNMVKTLLVRVSKKYGAVSSRSILVEPLVRIEFKGVSMQLKGSEKVLLENVSGMYHPGQMHAIMGPSGSGMAAWCH